MQPQDDGRSGERAPSPAAPEEEAVEEPLSGVPLAAQTAAVPETADDEEEGQATVTPDPNPNPDPAPSPESPVGKLGSPPSPAGAPPAPTPTPNGSPGEGKAAAAADIPGEGLLPAAAGRPGSASGTASRTICLRTLRGSRSTGALSNLAGWGGGIAVVVTPVAPAAVAAVGMEQRAPPETSAAAAPGQTGTVAVAAGAGGGMGVLPSANKVVDLREVKKVKPGPLASAVAPVPEEDSDADGAEEGAGGPVKIDISAGKRMIEFQLKQNAAEEKREAARVKSERERACAAAAEGSQRMLAQVNARIEAQRRAGGGVLGSRGGENLADQDGTAQSLIRRNLAEKHGIVVRFVDDGAASGVAQVRALARAHGIRVQILGQDGGGGGGCCFDGCGEEGAATLGGDGVDKAATPPPILSSLRTRAAPARRRSPSPVPDTLMKAPPRKTPAAPAAGMFSGPARMMRRALEASGGCVPSAKDASPEVYRGQPTSLEASSVGGGGGGGDGDEVPTPSGASSGDSLPHAPVSSEGAQHTRRAVSAGSKGGVVRPRPGIGSGGSAGSVDAASNGAGTGGVVGGSDSRDARSEGGSCGSNQEGSVDAATNTTATAGPGSSALKVSGRKRREAPGDTDQVGDKERRGGHAAGTTSKRAVGGGGDVGGAAGRRMDGRLGLRSAGPSGGEGGATPSARESKEPASSRTQDSVPKRMRLVAPSGVIVSQASDTPSTQNSGRRTSSGGTGWGPGNNNLFKGAMAGIMGRGKRPAP